LDLPRELYLVSADGKTLRPILRGFTSAGASAWSPDGRWLALPLTPSDAPEGLWLVEAATGKAHLLLAGTQFGGTEWLSRDTLAIAVGIFASYREPEAEDVGMYIAHIAELGELATTEAKSACA
jgi:hypothetical protein